MTPEAPLATGQATAPVPESTSLSRLFTVFGSPGATFADLARDPHFILAWCVQIVVAVIYAVTLMQRIGVYALARQALAQSPATAAMSPAAYQHALTLTSTIMSITMYAAPVWTIVLMLILALIFWGLGNFVLGYEARFKQSLAMVSYAYLTMTLFSILSIIVALFSSPGNFHITNPIGTNIGFFLDKASAGAFLFALGSHLDIFAIWTVILLGIGLACMSGKKGKTGGALSVVVVLWLLYILAASGLAAL
ncbi:MAG: YIP1 family protein [Terriglobales bacterium]